MTLSQPPTSSQKSTKHVVVRQLRHWRRLTVLAVAGLALLAASVAIGQVSQDFDLACRGIITATGGASLSSNFAITGALGVPIAPPKETDTNPTYTVRSADYAVRGGFLPAYPNAQSAAVAAVDSQSAPAIIEADVIQRLPFVRKTMRIIRGGC